MYHPLSIYDDDTLGEAGYHTVVLAGQANLRWHNLSASQAAYHIKKQLENLGYGIPSVRAEFANSWYSTDFTLNLTIEVNASTSHTDQQVRQMITRALLAIEWSSLAERSALLSNVALRVESDDYVAPNAPAPAVNPTNAGVNPRALPQSGGSSTGGDTSPIGSSLDLSSFAVGGLSGGVIIGLIALAVLLKK